MFADDFLGLVEEKKFGVRLMDDGIFWLFINCGFFCYRLLLKICDENFRKFFIDILKDFLKSSY